MTCFYSLITVKTTYNLTMISKLYVTVFDILPLYAAYIMLQPRVIDHYAKMENFNIGNFPIQYNNLHVDLHINYYSIIILLIE